jgi:hypothetical protein
MLTAELPGTQDAETLMPPAARHWFRRVPGQNLWLYFSFSETALFAVSLTRQPPIPLDE